MYEYQEKAKSTFIQSEFPSDDIARLALGLCGESGEVAEQVKKVLRGDGVILNEELTKELGDILWYIAVLASQFDIEMEDIAFTNITKLKDRAKRGVIKGSGDNR